MFGCQQQFNPGSFRLSSCHSYVSRPVCTAPWYFWAHLSSNWLWWLNPAHSEMISSHFEECIELYCNCGVVFSLFSVAISILFSLLDLAWLDRHLEAWRTHRITRSASTIVTPSSIVLKLKVSRAVNSGFQFRFVLFALFKSLSSFCDGSTSGH